MRNIFPPSPVAFVLYLLFPLLHFAANVVSQVYKKVAFSPSFLTF